MRARPLHPQDPELDAEQRAWISTTTRRRYHMVRIVVSFQPAPEESITRARVAFTLAGPLASSGGPVVSDGVDPPVIWSLSPRTLASDASRTTTVTVGAQLKILDPTRATTEQAMKTVRIRGVGELQPRAVWELTGSADEPFIGDQQFVTVVEGPRPYVCGGTLWVAFEMSSATSEASTYVANLQPASAAIWFD
jgi:hypothetical protein